MATATIVFGLCGSGKTWLGGTVRVIVLDNLKEGVLTPDVYDPTLNPLYRDVLAHYGVVALPCRVGEPNGLIFAAPDGLMSAYLLLAYDLYVLRNNGKLQSEVVQRLRHRDQFHGARYELFVAATFIRAGLQFEYDDETDGSRKHPEFVATDAAGLAMAVEAKARQRPLGSAEDLVTIRPAVRDLLLNAAKKLEDDPMVVFLEVNLPPHADLLVWGNHLDEVVKDITSEKGQCPFALVMFTNRPHLYGEFGMPDPTKQWVFFRPHTSPVSLELTGTLTTAVTQYGNIPDQFPDEFGRAPS